MWKKIKYEIWAFINAILMDFPSSGVGNSLRRFFLKFWLRHLGNRVNVFRHVMFHGLENISIGSNVTINTGCVIDGCDGQIYIGNKVSVGPYCVFRAADHVFSSSQVSIADQGHAGGTIHIEDDVWVGAQVVVLKDVRIGRGSVIGAGAVVTKDIPPFSVAVGVPARVIKSRSEEIL